MRDPQRELAPDLRGKGAIVTGAGRGIGRSIAAGLARCGAEVVLAARSVGELESLRDELAAGGAVTHVVPTDLARPESVRALFAATDDLLGDRLEIVVNNAGIGLYGDMAEFPIEELDEMLAVNVRGTFLACQEAVNRLRHAGRGYIMNVASVVGLKGYPRQGGYTATKHAIVGFSKTLAHEMQPHGVRVSVICPGGVDTDLVGAARPDLDRTKLLQPEDISRVVLNLLALPARAAIDCVYIRRSSSAPW